MPWTMNQTKSSQSSKPKTNKQGTQASSKRGKKKNVNKDLKLVNKIEKLERAVEKKVEPPLIRSLNSVVASQDSETVRRYVSHLIDPANTQPVGVPVIGFQEVASGLVNSIMTFDVLANPSIPAPNAGKFGFVVSPTFGDSADPSTFKVAMVDTSTSWPTDFESANSYQLTVGRTDLTVDPVARTMLQPPPTLYEASGTGVGTDPPIGSVHVIASFTDIMNNPAVTGKDILTNGVTGQNILTLPPGQYLASFESTFGLSGSSTSFVVTSLGTGVASLIEGNPSATGPTAQFVLSVYSGGCSFGIGWSGLPGTTWESWLTLTTSWALPSALADNPPGYPIDGGIVRQYVPVAMSVLATFIAPPLTVNGVICAVPLPAEVCANDIFTPQPRAVVGNPMNVDCAMNMPMNYSGELKDGAYIVWRPNKVGDTELKEPSAARDYAWPCLLISGQASFQSGTNPLPILRVIVSTTYQFTTDVKIFPVSFRNGDTVMFEAALKLMRTFPMASQNGKHWENIKAMARRMIELFGTAKNFYADNKSWINGAAAAALTLL